MPNKVKEIDRHNFKDLIKNSHKNIIFDFWAPWCGPCTVFTKTIKALADEYHDISFYSCNTDKNEKLLTELNITSLPTVMFYKEGKEIYRNTGALSKKQVEHFIQTKFS